MPDTKASPAQAAHDTFFSAADLKNLMAAREQAKEAEAKEKRSEADAARKAELDELKKSVEISEQQVEDAVAKFKTAAENGLTEMVVFSFPSELCTDGGRAINSALKGWQETLVGKPRSIYEAWQRYLKDKGYQFHARVLNFPHGMPGDIGLIIVWAHKDL